MEPEALAEGFHAKNNDVAVFIWADRYATKTENITFILILKHFL